MDTLTVEDKLSRARTKLVLEHPFFACIALRLILKEKADLNPPTMATDGRYCYYSREFVESLTAEEVQGVLAHEALHPAMLHHLRRGDRDPNKWNMAADYAINPIIIEAGMVLPKEALLNPKYNGMSAEEIYALLPKGQPAKWLDIGSLLDPSSESGAELSPQEREQLAGEWKQIIAEAARQARLAGKMPGSLSRMCDEVLKTVTPWRDLMASYLTEKRPDASSFKRPNRRFIQRGLYLPTITTSPTGDLVVVIDTSGSIGEAELLVFGGELRGIHTQIRPSHTYVIYCDTAVQTVDEFEPEDDVVIRAVGGGGTSFKPPFNYVRDNGIEPHALVYLTDGYGDFPEEPDYPTVWALTSDVVPPFGKALKISSE